MVDECIDSSVTQCTFSAGRRYRPNCMCSVSFSGSLLGLKKSINDLGLFARKIEFDLRICSIYAYALSFCKRGNELVRLPALRSNSQSWNLFPVELYQRISQCWHDKFRIRWFFAAHVQIYRLLYWYVLASLQKKDLWSVGVLWMQEIKHQCECCCTLFSDSLSLERF